MEIGLSHYLFVSSALFCLGLLALATRRNAVLMLMGVEFILNAANINLVAFSRYQGLNLDGHVFALFVIILAAAETAVALAIVLHIYRLNNTVDADRIASLKE
ncbi:MAG: NADH-quinone oxidoreductase subunit NuoK [Bacteroidota bacterium]|jgi:NADH-quinone oxidoreductase subunit K|nr:NADH-quinone oxidoreductase subunit NuoK [Bacteroidota bacterium]